MVSVKHVYLTVTSDQMTEEKFEGTLADFAAIKLNELIKEQFPDAKRIINIEERRWQDEIRPKQNNSNTWYKRDSLQLSVWLEYEYVVFELV